MEPDDPVDYKALTILAAVLCILFIRYIQEEQKKNAYLEALARQMKEEEKVIEDQISSAFDEINAALYTYLPGIVCWGDSLTAGAGGEGTTYPLVLQSEITEKLLLADFNAIDMAEALGNPNITGLSKYVLNAVDVVNMGVGGEDTNTILGRNGSVPFVVAEEFIIPESTEMVEISFISQNGRAVAPLRQGNRGMEEVTINGIEGEILIEESSVSMEYTYFFRRNTPGESEVRVAAGTEIITSGSEQYLNYNPIIFIGQNGGYSSIQDLIAQQRAIIDHQQMNEQNEGKFLIIGLHTGTAESRVELEKAMLEEYGEQYINLREYMSTQALEDAGMEPTEEDREMMEMGSTPSSLLSDQVHFNASGYELIGKQIYQRMEKLGYFDEVRETIDATH